jgi:hypothetical protein
MSNPPKALYKHVEPERIDILENLKIRFTPPTSFNDPFDLSPAIVQPSEIEMKSLERKVADRIYWKLYFSGRVLSRKEFDKILNGPQEKAREFFRDNPDFFREEFARRQSDWFGKTMGILCLSETANNLLMWSHYTDSHKGFIIEFDPRNPFFYKPDKPVGIHCGHLEQVEYPETENRPEFTPRGKDFHSMSSMFITKSIHWNYEQEWRVFQLLEHSNQRLTLGQETIHLFDLPPDCMTGIIVGCKMEEQPETMKRFIRAIKSNPHLSHLIGKICVAKKDSRKFSLNYVPLAI